MIGCLHLFFLVYLRENGMEATSFLGVSEEIQTLFGESIR